METYPESIPESIKEIQKIQQTARELSNFYNYSSDYIKEFRKVSKTLNAMREGQKSLKEIQRIGKEVQDIRKRIVHSVPKLASVSKPVYSPDEEENA